MPIEITMPELGENVEEGDVVQVAVTIGAQVREGQTLLEVEAEKSTVEVPSPSGGQISSVLVKKGDKVKTGQKLFVIEPSGDGNQAPSAPASKAPPAAPQPAKSEAKSVPSVPPATAQQTQPAAASTTAPTPRREVAPPVTVAAAPDGAAASRSPGLVPAGPATRRLARELGIDIALVHGSAPGGRVTQEDVKSFVKELATRTAAGAAPTAGPALRIPALPDFSKWGAIERKPLDAVRRKTAEQMALAWSQIPHVTHHDLADVTELDGFRKQQGESGPKLTVTAFALKAVAIALKKFPQFNSSLDLANNQLVIKQYYHLGLAVDTERGLLVPVLRDVDKKSVHELAKEMTEMAARARQKKLSADELRGGTFTITNLGGIGGTSFTPIINYPEVAILGMSRGRLQPVWRDGQAVPRLLLPLSLSYDHRVIDGADAARFVRYLAEMLENPLVMLLHA
jgi:pyruvate dehydrogenase E2 component (dihydrolipoamide acetyltransferase)